MKESLYLSTRIIIFILVLLIITGIDSLAHHHIISFKVGNQIKGLSFFLFLIVMIFILDWQDFIQEHFTKKS